MPRFWLLILVSLLLAVSSARAQDTSSSSSNPASRGGLTSVYRKDQVELQDKQGQVVLWIDSWARLHSPDFMIWQQDYNARLRRSFRSFVGAGLSSPEGIELVSFQPPGPRGIQSNGVFAVPSWVPENGVLTRDTLSLTFFDAGIQWNYFAHYLASDCEAIRKSSPAINCRDYQIDWLKSSEQSSADDEDDPLLLGLRYRELQQGLAALRRLQAQLGRVTTVTAEGVIADEQRDLELHDARKAECLRWSLTNNCIFEAADMRYPFDWLTAQVISDRLPAEFLDALHEAERDALLSVTRSREYRELSRSYADKPR